MAPSPSPVGLKLIRGYRVGKKIGFGAQASVHLLEPTAAAQAKNTSSTPLPTYAVKICPVPTKTTKKGLSEPEINERSIGKEFKLYNNHFPKLRDEGMLATMPFKDGIQPFGTKEGKCCHLSCIATRAFSVLFYPLVSYNTIANLLLLAFIL
jgi:hypothetical protein